MSYRNLTIDTTMTLTTEECCACGILFAMTDDHVARLRREKTWFYCPNGHSQQYIGRSDVQLRKDAERAAANAQEEARIARAETQKAERREAAAKAKLKSARRRAEAALCPVPGCNRQIIQMARHLHSKHPEFVHPETPK